MNELWPHQIRGIAETIQAIEAGENGVCLTSPTGGGKSRIMIELIKWSKQTERRTVLYTNRRLLLEQIQRVIAEAGIYHGIMAAGFKPDQYYPVQLASVQTILSRVYKHETWKLPDAQLVLIDEAHVNAAEGCERIVEDHKRSGASVVGFTATPVDLAHLYDRLVVAGTNSELRACGALVPCQTYAPDEPDAKALKTRTKTGDYPEGEVRKAIMTPTIFARVLDWYHKLNPDGRPTILFAPGVKESMWFAEQFRAEGISAAHIDGEDISYGELDSEGESVTVRSSREERERILSGSREGRIQVLCNRFVLREGIDAPWLSHCIFATVFGGLSSSLQAGGRLLRAHEGVESVTVQDHGGNWHRHGSLNSDRTWDLTWGPNVYSGVREQALREKKEPEPIVCPKCTRVRLTGRKCACGYEASTKSRMVVQLDGSLKEMTGDIYRPRRTAARTPNVEADWERMYHRARSEKWDATFAQAVAMFAQEHNWFYPPKDLPLMPVSDVDMFRKVRDVPRENLRQPGQKQRELV